MTSTLLLVLLILQASLRPTEVHGHVLEDVRDYEVIRPVRLHSVRKRQTEILRPEFVKYAMKVGGKDMELELERNDELLTKDYSETTYLDDGSPVTTVPNNIDHCYYQGRIVNDGESSASISICDGLRGYFHTAAQRYMIEPLAGDDEGDHAVTTFNPVNLTPSVCGVTNTTWSDNFEPPTSRSRSRSGTVSIVQQQKYVELYLVADHRQFQKMNRDQTATRKRMFEIINFVNLAYKPLKTFIALVGLEIWTNGDLSPVTPPAGQTLGAFTKWRNSNLKPRKPHDNAFLISAIDFDGSTVGLASVGTLCSSNSVGIVQGTSKEATQVGAILSHELGHNMGMNHDDSSRCTCPENSCIMSPAISWPIPRTFSSCSYNNYENYQTNRVPSCILDKPDYKKVVAPAVCGNGFVEKGEHCDCGTVEECTNPCCDAKTCRLSEESQCAEGDCCGQCKILAPSKECRLKRDDCDLAEYCDGKSATCPEDVFSVNGQSCDGGLGYCYNGQCPQRPNQCVKMYGTGATEAREYCYKQNKRGTYFAFCKRPQNDKHIPCQAEDIYCGKLFCSNGQSDPNYGRMVSFVDCKASFFGDYKEDYGQVDAGTECGDGKVCSNNECMDVATAYRGIRCSKKCQGHAVCNHKGECQCEPGWMPPSCISEDDNFRTLSPAIIAGIVFAVLLVLSGIIAAVVGLLWKKRKAARTATKQFAVDQSRYHLGQPLPEPKTRPKGAPPPPPPAGNAAKPNNYAAARQALKPAPHPPLV